MGHLRLNPSLIQKGLRHPDAYDVPRLEFESFPDSEGIKTSPSTHSCRGKGV